MIQQFSRLAITSQDYLFSQIGDSQIPSQFHNSADIHKLDSMMIQNFKSFDRKYVGPFLNFTCIIGPNGSGKSNILDALMFCFCSENSRHALIDARQLINRQGKQTFKELAKLNRVCKVQATFVLKNAQKLIISRSLDPEGKQQYLINFKPVNKRMYQNILIRKGINSNSPNYAIWQGQIDRLILKDPSQLKTLLQNLSGSIYLKKTYEQAQEQLKQIQTVIEETTRKINKFKLDRKNLKSIKHTSEEYSKYDAQYQDVLRRMYYLQVLEKEKSIQELEDEIKAVGEEERKKLDEINQLKANAQRDYSKKQQLQQQLTTTMSALAQNHSLLHQIGHPANILLTHRLKQAEQQQQTKQKQIQFFQQKKKQLQQHIPQIPSSALIQEYLELYEKWESENMALHREVMKKNGELLVVCGLLQARMEVVAEYEDKRKRNLDKVKDKKKVIDNLKEDLRQLTESIKQMQSESAKVSQQAQKHRLEYEAKNKAYEQTCLSIQELQQMISDQAQTQKQAQMLKVLSSIDGFQGALHQKIKPSTSKYDICFTVMVGNMSKYLLCQSQQSSKKIGNRLKEIRLMKNVVILDNVVERKSNDLRKILGKDAVMGIDIVDFDQGTRGLKEYMSQILHGKVVCDTMAMAYKIRNRNIEGVKEIYTLEGDVIRKDGIISSCGNPDMLKKTHKFSTNKSSIYTQLSALSKQKLKLESDLQTLKLKFDQKQLIKRNLELDQLTRKKQTTALKLKQLQSQQIKEVALPQSITNEIKDLQKQRDKLEKVVKELEKMIQNSKIFQKFLEKYGVQSLEGFRNANNFQHIQGLMKKKNEIGREILNIQAELEKMEKQQQRRRYEIKKLQEEVRNIPEMGDKTKIEKLIAQQQKQLVDLRNKISKLSQITRTQASFQSTLPTLQAKLAYAKQKMHKQLEQLSYEYGIEYRYPIPYAQIQKQLNLPKKLTDRTLENVEQKLKQERTKIQEQLDKHNSINLLVNVQEDEEKIEKGMNTLLGEIDEAIKHRKKWTQQLQLIRKDRAGLLVNFVNSIKQHLSSAYRILTEQEDGSSGTVNLHLENEDEPFQHGIYFTPTPPTKRFVYDLQQLSGGQRSIASLALQYSISLATKSPVLILDETDAFLDINNVDRFLKLINNSMQTHKIQIIVVTHKQGLFSKSESLVGVSRPKSLNFSQVYSLKLTED